eukprot:11231162-Karenia_brevis.AAC.1
MGVNIKKRNESGMCGVAGPLFNGCALVCSDCAGHGAPLSAELVIRAGVTKACSGRSCQSTYIHPSIPPAV